MFGPGIYFELDVIPVGLIEFDADQGRVISCAFCVVVPANGLIFIEDELFEEHGTIETVLSHLFELYVVQRGVRVR